MPDLRGRYFDSRKSYSEYFKEAHTAGALGAKTKELMHLALVSAQRRRRPRLAAPAIHPIRAKGHCVVSLSTVRPAVMGGPLAVVDFATGRREDVPGAAEVVEALPGGIAGVLVAARAW